MTSAGVDIVLEGNSKVLEKLGEITSDYVENCNKTISQISNISDIDKSNDFDKINDIDEIDKNKTEVEKFTVDDIIKELNYCTDIFMLAKEGEIIACDCGNSDNKLFFDGEKVVYKGAEGSLAEKDIPTAVKNHEKRCFGTCLIENPSRHPGEKAKGGNDCEPYIVGASWLETYNNAKADGFKLVMDKKSWLACKYMGRIAVKNGDKQDDKTNLTKEEAFQIMLDWAKGEYVPQVILDKATLVYAGGDSAVTKYMNEFTNKYKDNKGIEYKNMIKFDSKIMAWSYFVNEMWGEDADNYLKLRPILVKAMCMKESSLGEEGRFNSEVNIMQSINTGDGGLWWLSKINPYPHTFEEMDKSGILAWKMNDSKGGSRGELETGHVEAGLTVYFDDEGERKYSNNKDSLTYFGKADIGENEILNIKDSIKYIETHDQFPVMTNDDRDQKYKDVLQEGKIIIVNHAQQSVDMSLMAGCFELANKSSEEREAVVKYNYDGEQGEKYADGIEVILEDFCTSFGEVDTDGGENK